MRLFWPDYLTRTAHLTSEELGALTRLLGFMWLSENASLRHDDKQLRLMAGVHPPNWKRVKAAILPFFVVEGDQLTQEHIAAEWRRAVMKVETNRAAGSMGGQMRALRYSRPRPQPHTLTIPKPLMKKEAPHSERSTDIRTRCKKEEKKGEASPSPLDSGAAASLNAQSVSPQVEAPKGLQGGAGIESRGPEGLPSKVKLGGEKHIRLPQTLGETNLPRTFI